MEKTKKLVIVGSGETGLIAYEYFQFGIDVQTKFKIEDLITQRNEAKKVKDFTKADSVRDELSELGISLMDTINGTVWEKL